MALTVFDSEMKEWRWGEYKSKSERIGKKGKLVIKSQSAAGRHVLLNVSMLKESFDARVSPKHHQPILLDATTATV